MYKKWLNDEEAQRNCVSYKDWKKMRGIEAPLQQRPWLGKDGRGQEKECLRQKKAMEAARANALSRGSPEAGPSRLRRGSPRSWEREKGRGGWQNNGGWQKVGKGRQPRRKQNDTAWLSAIAKNDEN